MNVLSKATLIFALLTSSFSPDILAVKRLFTEAFQINDQNYTNETIDYAISALKNFSELTKAEQKQLKLFLLSPEKHLEHIFGEEIKPIESVELKNYDSDNDECPQCPICKEVFKNKEHDVLLTPAQCKHILHTQCASVWLTSHSVDEFAPPASAETRTCPMCRKNLIFNESGEVSFKLIMQKMDKELLNNAKKLKLALLKRIYSLGQFLYKQDSYNVYNLDELLNKFPKGSLYRFSIELIKENKDITVDDLLSSNLSRKTLIWLNVEEKQNKKKDEMQTQNTDDDKYSLNDLLIEGLSRTVAAELKSADKVMDVLENIISEKLLQDPTKATFLRNVLDAVFSLFEELRKGCKLASIKILADKISVEIDKAFLGVNENNVRFFELRLIKSIFYSGINMDKGKKIISEFNLIQKYTKKEIWENSDFIRDTILGIAEELSGNFNEAPEDIKLELNDFVLTEFVAKGAWEDGYNISSSLSELVASLTGYLLKLENNEDIINKIVPALTLVIKENTKHSDNSSTSTALKISETVINFLDEIEDESLIKDIVTKGIYIVNKSINNGNNDIMYSSVNLLSSLVSLIGKNIEENDLVQKIMTTVINFCKKNINHDYYLVRYCSINLLSSLVELLPITNNDKLETKIVKFSVDIIINNTNSDYLLASHQLISFADLLIDNVVKIDNSTEELFIDVLMASIGLIKPASYNQYQNSTLLIKCMRCLDKIKSAESRRKIANKIKLFLDKETLEGHTTTTTSIVIAKAAIDMYLEKLDQYQV